MSVEESLKFLDEFEKHYQYDCDYMREMIEVSPEGFQAFEGFMPMGQFQQSASTDILAVARLTAMKAEDCGACVQLNIRMALEAGVSKDVLKSIMNNGEGLSGAYKDIYDFASTKIYPAIKRALNYDKSCALYTFEY